MVNIRKRGKGYYDLLKREIVPCQSFADLTESEYCQCKSCQTKSGFDLCLGCNGSICQTNSDTARKFCNEEHHVYLHKIKILHFLIKIHCTCE